MSSAIESCTSVAEIRTCLNRLQSVGLAIVAESGIISFVALIVLFGLIVRNVIRYYRNPPDRPWSLIQTPADAYVLSLFVADIIQSIGASMDIRWVKQGFVQIGGYCTAQGITQELGETAVACATMAITVHTFFVIWMRKGSHNLKVAFCVIAVYWLFLILYIVIADTTKKNYFNPDTLWCWIGEQYFPDKVAGEYLWLWATLFVSFLTYLPLFLWSRGNITVHQVKWWKVQWHWRARTAADVEFEARARPNAPSLALLAYPVAYTIVVLPVSITRWSTFTGHTVPDTWTFFTVFLHNSFGAVNVLLLLTTRPNLLLFEPPSSELDNALESNVNYGHAPALDSAPPSPNGSINMQEIRVRADDERRGQDLGHLGANTGYGFDDAYGLRHSPGPSYSSDKDPNEFLTLTHGHELNSNGRR